MNESQVPTRWTRPVVDDGLTRPSVFDRAGTQEHAPPEFGERSLLGMGLAFVGLVRRNWLLVLLTTGSALGLTLYRLSEERPIYQATAVIRITDRSPLKGGGSNADAVRMSAANGSILLSQIQVLQSRGIAREVAARAGLRLRVTTRNVPAGLIRDPHVDSTVENGTMRLRFGANAVEVSGWGDRVRAAYGTPAMLHGVRFVVPARPEQLDAAELAVVTVDSAANEVFGRLRGTPRPGTDIIDVSYQDDDKYRATGIVNAAVLAFQSNDALAAKQESKRKREFIEQQLEKTELLLNEAELAHNRLQSRQQVARVQGRGGPQQADISGMAMRRDELESQRAQLAHFLDSTATALTPAGRDRLAILMSSPTTVASPALVQSYQQFSRLQTVRDSLTTGVWARSAQDPDVRRLNTQIASSDSALFRVIRSQVSALDMRISALDDVKQRMIDEISRLPEAQVAESGLTSQADSYRRQAEQLRTQLQAAQIDEAAQSGQVEVIDPALLPRLIGTGRTSKIALAILIGLGLGAAIAYVIENHKPVIRRRDELERAVPLPNLAMVPQIRRKPTPAAKLRGIVTARSRPSDYDSSIRAVPELVTFSDARSTCAEAYRTLRTNLLFSAAVQSLKRIVVTSAGPKEGKTMTTANLAIAFAQQGQRVVIVDCDLRRPRIHKMFNRPAQPGLTDLLIGRHVIADTLHRTPHERLMVLTAGTMPPNPAEMLGSPQMKELLDKLSETFDIIIIDTPPLLAASDAAIIGRVADGTLVVVRAGQTQRAAIIEGMNHLDRVGARILGTVLNDPDAEVAKFAPYYQYYYNNYYEYSEK